METILYKLNYFIYRLRWKFAKYLKPRKPLCIDLELSSICNLKCSFCYHSDNKIKFPKQFMNYNAATQIILEAARLKVPSLKFNFRGEPTLYPDLLRILTIAKYHSTHNTFIDRIINTNLQFDTDREDIFKALLTCTTIKISIDTLNESTYEKQRGSKDYLRVVQNLKKLYSMKTNQRIVLCFVRTIYNAKEDFNKIKDIYPDIEISVKDFVGGRNSRSKSPQGKRKVCTQAFTRLIITSNLDMQLCCPDITTSYVLGNYKNTLIQSAFNSKRANWLRMALWDGMAFEIQPCKNCSSYESHKGWKGNWKS